MTIPHAALAPQRHVWMRRPGRNHGLSGAYNPQTMETPPLVSPLGTNHLYGAYRQ